MCEYHKVEEKAQIVKKKTRIVTDLNCDKTNWNKSQTVTEISLKQNSISNLIKNFIKFKMCNYILIQKHFQREI